MVELSDKIITWHPEGKRGSVLQRRDYILVAGFIFSSLKSNEMSIGQLIDSAEEELAGKIVNSVSWLVLTVKLDLEARGFISSRSLPVSPYPMQYLRLKPGALKKMRGLLYTVVGG